ncbi:hypothetical protein SEA_YEET_2 [Mycobacterium phage Yeet]|uniref:Uncharacterized protein n=5 Tax=root TaxID=1 RepID=A0A3S9UAM4_9CAUD|nr:hypothetical protein [Acinetobacter baumannii]YP_009018014.1 terminase large subunit [Mycobacterium phage Thibault]YP_009123956.1 terminase large subunit [Mycobacterium phage Minerva]YP_009590859.1 terminase large subunit [Mycobacterium phage Optimus]YP_009636174.1 terminase large subunit [Mycobacterium phage Baka]ATN88813.1 hypothetical protein SEA_DMPSTRDIVER_3 [Mycobacterium phage DmpstrDiver]AXF51492.1 hypothetical protein CONSTELLA_2 [Mycobacterium phage Constella]AXQ52241.1 hypothet
MTDTYEYFTWSETPPKDHCPEHDFEVGKISEWGPLEDDSRWTLVDDIVERCLQPMSEFLKDVLAEADLSITVNLWHGHQEDDH